MSRRRVAEKTTILPDPKYGDMVLAKFINIIMRSGKKSIAEKIVYGALNEIYNKGNSEPVEIFNKALENIKPAASVLFKISTASRNSFKVISLNLFTDESLRSKVRFAIPEGSKVTLSAEPE